jgi:hypothetical protein
VRDTSTDAPAKRRLGPSILFGVPEKGPYDPLAGLTEAQLQALSEASVRGVNQTLAETYGPRVGGVSVEAQPVPETAFRPLESLSEAELQALSSASVEGVNASLVPGVAPSSRAITEGVSEEESHLLRNVVVLTLAAVLAVKSLDWLRQSREWERRGGFDPKLFALFASTTFRNRLERPLVPLVARLFVMGRLTVGVTELPVAQRLRTEKAAQTWARAYAAKVAQDYADSSSEIYRPLVRDWVQRPLPATAMALRARDLYGLDARAATSVINYTNGKGRTDPRTLIERYLEQRALANATVYSVSAQNFGRAMGYAQMMAEGQISPNAKKVWQTAHDERVCDYCGPMDGVTADLIGPFSVRGNRLLVPPVHPHCRCTIAIDEEIAPKKRRRFPEDPHKVSSWLAGVTDLLR